MRALHVVAVVIWIGGVSMVTTVVLPAIRRGELGTDPDGIFPVFERRFAWQARVCVLIVGVTGFYMAWRLVLWSRFESASFWWMHAMVAVWLLFTLMLFVVEPLILRHRLQREAGQDPQAMLARLQRGHWLLLILSLITVLAAVAGSHGWVF
ncbi:MAG TPA: CopD family protein [Steroidobacteraceae bacterium]|nr:CopD family protein [Steroidobacteraceae bacterium]